MRLMALIAATVAMNGAAAGDLAHQVAIEINAAIARDELPGAVVAVWHKDRVLLREAYGQRSTRPNAEPMTVDTVFDLASLTKPVATATAVMRLVETGALKLDEKVATYWPEFGANGKDALTLEHLLLHTSGLIADNPIGDYADGPAKSLERIAALKPLAAPGSKFIYSDVNFIVLGELVGRASPHRLDELVRINVFEPLAMNDTGFQPAESLRPRVAPTEQRDGEWLRGQVHDPRAAKLGGVAGHAGLFGTADDLIRFGRMMLGGGQLDGTRVLKPETVKLMTTPRPVPGGLRGLGWDVRTGFSANRGARFPRDGGFGHTGFTGTSIWIDPASETVVVFLSNSVHPDGKGNVKKLRGRVASLVAEHVGYAAPTADGTLTGIDVLAREKFERLKGRRVGLVTNHTGRDRNGQATIDLLHAAEGVKLAALFSPEHGIRGALDENVKDGTDEKTGLPVFSLYGPRRKPTPELLRGIDTVVYDIQDIGCRFYTYISTLGLVMEACAENKLKLVVLDRPNPIGGVAVDGPMTDAGRESFVAFHHLPVRHGLTVGELAQLFRAERKLDVDLEVIKIERWTRADLFDRTLLPWVNPSPNMRTLTQALLYPGVGLLETTNVSVGRGTDQPFEWVGAPWLDGRKWAAALAAESLAGVRFVPASRTPASSVHAKKDCGGVQIIVDDWAKADPLRLGLALAVTLRGTHRNDWDPKRYDTLLVNKAVYDALLAGKSTDELVNLWKTDVAAFRERRRAFLLYD